MPKSCWLRRSSATQCKCGIMVPSIKLKRWLRGFVKSLKVVVLFPQPHPVFSHKLRVAAVVVVLPHSPVAIS